MTPTEWFSVYSNKVELAKEREKDAEQRRVESRTGAKAITLQQNLEMGRQLRAERYLERLKKERAAHGDDA